MNHVGHMREVVTLVMNMYVPYDIRMGISYSTYSINYAYKVPASSYVTQLSYELRTTGVHGVIYEVILPEGSWMLWKVMQCTSSPMKKMDI